MSEHLSIKGKIEYLHSAYDEEGAFTFCHHCKKTLKTAIVELHEGIAKDSIVMKCPKCKKSIWFASLTNSKKTLEKGFKNDSVDKGGRTLIFNNHKCNICKKPTNRFDGYAHTFNEKNKMVCYCSEKCWKKKKDLSF